MIVFDVGRGMAIAIWTPSGDLILIDCGRSPDYSPIDQIAAWYRSRGYSPSLTYLIITHPHQDHICDIESLYRNAMMPAFVTKRQDLDWKRIYPDRAKMTAASLHYVASYFPPNYTSVAGGPNLGPGFSIRNYYLDPYFLNLMSCTDQQYANNSSIISIIEYQTVSWKYRVAVAGDMETLGMLFLLVSNPGFRNDLKGGFDFVVTPHHGHASGFCNEWFKHAGATRRFNIASEKRGTLANPSATDIDPRYSMPFYSCGWNQEGRRLVSTKERKNILIKMYPNGTWQWEQFK